jgi:hypothetical protein
MSLHIIQCPRVHKLKATLSASNHEIPVESMSFFFEGISAFLQEWWAVLVAAAVLPLSFMCLKYTKQQVQCQREIQKEKDYEFRMAKV